MAQPIRTVCRSKQRLYKHSRGGEKDKGAGAHLWVYNLCRAFGELFYCTSNWNSGHWLCLARGTRADKTTILRLLSGITKPTEGRISVRGRMGVLIELSAGFHPELTGRENIYLNASILGMTRKETARKFDAIVEFAELKGFMGTPAKRYSSGMMVRLGFSVAVHVDPEVLLVDEVLSVGDMSFQRKCLNKMEELRKKRLHWFLFHTIWEQFNQCVAMSYG